MKIIRHKDTQKLTVARKLKIKNIPLNMLGFRPEVYYCVIWNCLTIHLQALKQRHNTAKTQ